MKGYEKKSRGIAWLLAASMVLGLSACSSSTSPAPETSTDSAKQSSDSGKDGDDSVYEIQVLAVTPTKIQKSDETVIGQAIRDKFGIVFEFIPFSGDYKEKCNLMLAGGDYPEIVRLEYNEMVLKYTEADALVNLEPYIAESQYFKYRFQEQLPYFRLASGRKEAYSWQSDVPNDMEVKAEFNDVLVRSDALEKQGWPMLVSESDYIAFLEQGLKDFPTTNGQPTIGCAGPMGETWGMTGVIGQFYDKTAPTIQTAGMRSFIWNETEEKFEYRFLNQDTQQGYRFFNTLHRKGLLDNEFFTDKGQQVEEKMSQGLPLMVWYSVWLNTSANQKLEAAGTPEMSYVRMPIKTDEQVERGEKRLARIEVSRPYDSYAITKKAKDPDRIFALLDWAVSDEGQTLLQGGIEGVHYTLDGDQRVPTQEFIDNITDTDWAHQQGFQIFSFLGRFNTIGENGQAYNLLNDPVWRDELYLNDRLKEVCKAMNWNNSNQYWFENSIPTPHSLPSSVEIDPASELGALQQKMLEHWVKAGSQLVLAETEEEFESLLKTAEEEFWKLNPDKVLDEATRLYQEQKAALDSLK